MSLNLFIGDRILTAHQLIQMSKGCIDGSALVDKVLKLKGCENMDHETHVAILKWYNKRQLLGADDGS